ncbi:MAG: 4'-phosphopantetheinyl transferase superfamily protein [Bacteroidales bacterium]|nr:4'-phosphopantetheinyl transferase superfamily protein [Bacteroidales bacterium]MDD2425574.1 4'-phosphopantetheinyl transferase superfamily protein [Bacteroidales bacterium]MDD3989430.1 4'-phosphopantetheinyl transferase superfamily protein [Bacteroidales bacterium]MDD4638254.1 4'-phosphopantetheinyl transferase superfamily protein [Bacteroidales bacterium]
MALFYSRELENGATISVWEITESEEELLSLSSVPSDELEELALIKNTKRRRERLAVRALLNEVFEGKVYLGHHDNGRPFLQNSLIEISISHTERFVAILTHPEESVGIDIESLDRDFSAVEKKALSESEIEFLSDKNRDLHLAICWSAKEAIYKRMSLSGVDYSKQILLKRFSPRDEGEIEAFFIHEDGEQMEFELGYTLFEGHVMVWMIG